MRIKIVIVSVLSIIVLCLLLIAVDIITNSVSNAVDIQTTEKEESNIFSSDIRPVTKKENYSDKSFDNDKNDSIIVEKSVFDEEVANEFDDYEIPNNESETNELPGVPIE